MYTASPDGCVPFHRGDSEPPRFLEDVDVSGLLELFALPPRSGPVEPHLPEEPPPTPEGDRIALEAVERMAGSIPITDPELGRWIAESPDLSLYRG
jgi:hypothetical protein